MRKKALIRISGTVQGVGFRPFVYRTAETLGIRGYVKNLGDAGVEILAEGEKALIKEFLETVKKDHPPNARIDDVSVEWIETGEKTDRFHILPSGGTGLGGTIPADYGICNSCIADVSTLGGRRFRYPLTSCTDCGPRFTILENLPLDRKNTSFNKFPPCDDCAREYRNPQDRRFHAQTIACPKCGPGYSLLDGKGNTISNPIETGIEKLRAGKILAIKGVGGIHLACIASDDDVLKELRGRRGREQQPFAIMSRLENVKTFAHVSKTEERLLTSRETPIVILRKRKDSKLSRLVSPGLENVGVMLPYTALHHMLFSVIDEPLVMTSANVHGEPMTIDNEEILRQKAADYYLLHDLEIKNRCDDSVIKIVNEAPVFIRRSRGFVPIPVALKNPANKTVLSLGAGENVTFCLLKGDKAFPSQHIGNIEKLSTINFLQDAIERFLKNIPAKIDVISCDMHPGFNTTKLAKELSERYEAPLIQVQHHHAHLMTLAGEHGLEEMIGICCDGVGYGLDGKAWGGEVFTLKGKTIERAGHLKEQPMPGGDLAAHYPARMVAGILYGLYSDKELRKILGTLYYKHGREEIEIVLKQLEKGVNVHETTSTGRVFDAVSALLGVCSYRTYEGEPAMKLEAAAEGGRDLGFPVEITGNIIDTAALVRETVEARNRNKTRDIAYSFEKALAKGLAEIAIDAARDEGIGVVGASGGVAYNDLFVRTIAGHVKGNSLRFVQNLKVPCGDGGISYGQAAYAARNPKHSKKK